MAEIMVASNKVKVFRGKQVEDLKKLDTREFAKFLKSRERRSVMRNFNVIEEFVKRSEKKINKGKVPKTQCREMVIVPAFVGWTIGIHNGKEFVPIKITEEMLGHRLGEFTLTRKIVKHGAAGIGATKGSSALSVK